ncbi:Hypothetical protein, putative [Bodo saltans]|uniref:Uncharacterized protein n=1 Tax=Bodo saltans TaxID=75058 RepID=A0A0S4JTQ8_BODSA|nr:Hypothetical protein, putative [Bodo saltans]|eukprot:CUG93599.1 Hypothetical protein, putative [Bodo saltans]
MEFLSSQTMPSVIGTNITDEATTTSSSSPPRTQPQSSSSGHRIHCDPLPVNGQQQPSRRASVEEFCSRSAEAGAPLASSTEEGYQSTNVTIDRIGSNNQRNARHDQRAARFSGSAASQRIKQQFSIAANSLTALYQESSRAYAAGATDARDEVHQYILDAVRRREPTDASTSTGRTGDAHTNNVRSSRTSRRWIDADQLLAFLALANLQSNMSSTTTTSSASSASYDVAHTFGRRRPRDVSPTWAWNEGDHHSDDWHADGVHEARR